jgi:hypothetical protein
VFGLNDPLVKEEDTFSSLDIAAPTQKRTQAPAPTEGAVTPSASPVSFGVKDPAISAQPKKEIVSDLSAPSLFDQAYTDMTKSVAGVAVPKYSTFMDPKKQQEFASAETVSIEDKQKINYKDLTKPEVLEIIERGATAMFGDSGKRDTRVITTRGGVKKEAETKEQYVDRWLRSMRFMYFNEALDGSAALLFLRNANDDDFYAAQPLFEIYDSLPDAWEEGGQGGITPFTDALAAIASNPLTAGSILAGVAFPPSVPASVAGVVGRKVIAKEAVKRTIADRVRGAGQAIAARKKGIIAGATVEGVGSGAEDAVGQAREIEARLIDEATGLPKDKIDLSQVGLSTAIGVLAGGFLGQTGTRLTPEEAKQALERRIRSRVRMPEGVDPDSAKVIKVLDRNLDEILAKYDVSKGDNFLYKEGADIPAATTKTINARAVEVAKYIMLLDPASRPTDLTKQGAWVDAVEKIIARGQGEGVAVDDEIMAVALRRAGVTKEEFAKLTRSSVADWASGMQAYSALSRVITPLMESDDAALKSLEAFRKSNALPDSFWSFWDGVIRLERESKALVVSSIATTMRNAMGSTTAMTFDSFTKLVDGALYHTAKTGVDLFKGKYTPGDWSKGINGTMDDAFNGFFYLKNQGIANEIVEYALEGNPQIREKIFYALQESGNQKLSTVARFANSLNVAQDVLFRRAAFSSSLEYHMKNVGLDMLDFIDKGKKIPTDLLQKAADDALKTTFAYMPKTGPANLLVRGMEQTPFMSLIVPFPRFMSNAIRFTADHMPFISMSRATSDAFRAAFTETDPEKQVMLWRKASNEVGKTVAGASALIAAYQYRTENPELPWYMMQLSDNTSIDTRAIFPLAPVLGIAELHRMVSSGMVNRRSVTEILESLVGMKLPKGETSYFFEQLPQMAADILESMEAAGEEKTEGVETQSTKKLKEQLGDLSGSFITRFIQPAQPLFALAELFDRESEIARDPTVPNRSMFIQGLRNMNMLSEEEIKDLEMAIDKDLLSVEEAIEYEEAGMLRPGDKAPGLSRAAQMVETKIPGVRTGLAPTMRRLREETPMRAGEFFSVITGLRKVPALNAIEKEAVRIGVDDYKMFGTQGNKEYDRDVITNSAEQIQKELGGLLRSKDYREKTDKEKREMFASRLQRIIGSAREKTKAQWMSSKPTEYYKMMYESSATSTQKRALINELHKSGKLTGKPTSSNYGSNPEDYLLYEAYKKYADNAYKR